ncbi:hypothetical protein LC607_16605 [Nostoc sp. CHAB 5824]|nr:hypothetical protein [Nostoc sp. CHAB 5824]
MTDDSKPVNSQQSTVNDLPQPKELATTQTWCGARLGYKFFTIIKAHKFSS